MWKYGYGLLKPSIEGDKCLIIGRGGSHYAAGSLIKFPIDNTNEDLIIQYELRFQKSMSCSGAYLKLLSSNVTDLSKLNNKSPYIIMFGPDKCGNDKKVQLIFRHYDRIKNEWILSHIKEIIPFPSNDKYTHLYTLVIQKDNSVKIYIDLKEVFNGNLLYDFEPPFIPPAVFIINYLFIYLFLYLFSLFLYLFY